MKPKMISPSTSPRAVGPYSHAIRVGDLLFASGQIPLDPGTGQMAGSEISSQTVRVLENIKLILENEGLGLQNVIKTTVFMIDLTEFGIMNEIYGNYFKENFPARSTVQVSALPRGARIEIEFLAHYSTP